MKLTERQTDILRLLTEGLSNKQIGSLLYIAENTVNAHIINIYRKFGYEPQQRGSACNRIKLAIEGYKMGLLE